VYYNILMRMPRFVIAFILLSGLSFGQDIHENMSVDLVNVYLSATDSDGHFVTDLTSNDLALTEDGQPQHITHFSNFALESSDKLGEKDVPLTLALVMDESTSMGAEILGTNKMDIVKNAAFRLLDELKKDDRMMLITFNDIPSEETPLTSDKKTMERDLLFQSVGEGGETALLDSIYFAMKKIKDQQGRKMIVVFSDGEDTASNLKLDEVISNLIASDITVLAFGTMSLETNSIRGRYILQKLADASGGYAFFPSSLRNLKDVMEKLRAGMRSQYSLGYTSTNNNRDGSWRTIEINCKRSGIKLRYRKGYTAS
jgi:Ca-activated chloride channel family protein